MTKKNQDALAQAATARANARLHDAVDLGVLFGTVPTERQDANGVRDHAITADRTSARPACECGCGDTPAGKKSRFCPGHDAKAASALRGPKEPTICLCGCEGETKGGRFLPGHDARYHAAQKKLNATKPLVDLIAMCEQVA